jgi:hypothetical protein
MLWRLPSSSRTTWIIRLQYLEASSVGVRLCGEKVYSMNPERSRKMRQGSIPKEMNV